MDFKKVFIGFFISLVVIAALLSVADRQTQAQGYDPSVSRKLDDILKGQKDILTTMQEMREEIRIIKIRITQSQ